MTGTNVWVNAGQAETWNTTKLLYFTDTGNLSASVTHAQADAMVANAAAVWNVPTSSIALAQGGVLAEHVSSANSYFDGTGFSFPPDVTPANENAVPVPIIYDTDGSLTEMLLGAGASEPAECRQDAVTESVDDIQPDGHIHHAMVVLNGRCAGSAPEQLTQMQYQLARAFGRVLGLAWSQANDNVFTAVSQVTADQVAYWPLMHPLDVLCGPYSYQCMTNPFTLRLDDLNSLETQYPVLQNSVPQGKQASDTDADFLWVNLTFPSGQGMDWVNFTARRQHYGVMDDYELASSVTGTYFQQAVSTPITGAAVTNQGSNNSFDEAHAPFRVIPVEGLSNIFLTSQPVNPLYWGEFALGPYVRAPVTPSGSPQTWVAWSAQPYPDNPVGTGVTAWDAPSACNPGNDGTESAPATLDASGWQPGLLCGWGHSSWWNATIPAGRTWAFEVTATDENGNASTGKAATVFGMWGTADAAGTKPTVAAIAVPFNSQALGVTQAQMPAFAADTALRFAVSDLYGAGRPDFTYTARLLYIGAAAPTNVGFSGGTVTVTGSGFRHGVVLYVNGVAATTTQVGSTTLTAVVPPASVVGATVGTPVPLAVVDTLTGASSSVEGALTYSQVADVLKLVSAPTVLEATFPAATPFAVQVFASDGLTPLANTQVRFTASTPNASFPECSSASACVAVTDPEGIARVSVVSSATGTVTLLATEVPQSGLVPPSIQMTLEVVQPQLGSRMVFPDVYVAAGSGGSWMLQLAAVHDANLMEGVPVTWTGAPDLVLSAADMVTGAAGVGRVTVTAAHVDAGQVLTVTGCVWNGVCATWNLTGVASPVWRVQVAAGAEQTLRLGASSSAALAPVSLLVTDDAGHVLQGAPVSIFQRVLAWEGVCRAPGACPAAPVLKAGQSSMPSGADGTVQVAPLQVAGVAQTVQIAASSGDNGFITTTLTVTPPVSP